MDVWKLEPDATGKVVLMVGGRRVTARIIADGERIDVLESVTGEEQNAIVEWANRVRGNKGCAVYFPDDITIVELARHMEHANQCGARFVEAVEVTETHEGRIVWAGAVKVFDLVGHPQAKRAYAWIEPGEGNRRRFVSVLGISPVDSPAMAVRTMILSRVREAERAKN